MRAKLTITVDYSNTITKQEARGLLINAANHLANEGLLSGDSPVTVDDWNAKVSVVSVDGE